MSTATSNPGSPINRRTRRWSPPIAQTATVPAPPTKQIDDADISIRSDDGLQPARDAIARCSHLNDTLIELVGTAQQLTLRGEVDSFFQKQLAQEVLLQLDGVGQVRNSLHVRQSQTRKTLTGPCAVRHF